MSKYRSSPLRTISDEDDCPTCKFLKGDHSTEVLLKVIENLDHVLANEEELTNSLLKIQLPNI